MADLNPKLNKIDLGGRSMVLNAALIVLNLAGVFCLVKGYHLSAGENAGMFKIIGYLLLLLSLGGLFVLKGLFLYSYVARALVGGLFIVSGLIKANDPWGFAFKLDEYFAPEGLTFDFPFFESFTGITLELAILISIAEIVLGVAVILGGKIKLTSWLLVFMMAFFTWLTWYTASCNATQEAYMEALRKGETVEEFHRQCVTDCGCFGDALRGSVGRSLTPMESFWKDLVLFYFVLIIFLNQWKIKLNEVKENWIMVPASMIVVIFFSWVFGWLFPIFFALFVLLGSFVIGNLNIGKMGKPWKMAIFVSLISFIFTLYTSMYMEIKDYRPYKIGNNLREQMTVKEPRVVEYVLKYEELATGKIIDFKVDEWEIYTDTSKYKFKDRVETVISEGIPATITDFSAMIKYDYLTESDKKIPYIDSLIQSDYGFYYEEKLVLKHAWGVDTIPLAEYDTLYYPDSIYTKTTSYTGLVNPDQPWELDLKEFILSSENIFIMTIRKMDEVTKDQLVDIKKVYEGCLQHGIPFVVLTPATREEIDAFKTTHDFNPMFLSIDGTEIKIIIRSNPGLVLLQNATVINKWPWRSIPEFDDMLEEYFHITTQQLE
ncbi:MAG: DoxX family protein [Crocinitomicaceae bacterium]|nr:DoxX family protein [Crocinitomicaceae bacterium]MBK8924819.1 DoxX family protein [Crocinitomicaceae bacterium]